MKKHTVTISSCFVKNIKRMWDSPFAAYKEIIQNALRAGAEAIRVTVEDDTLIVEDDGRGVNASGLRSLLTIGDSGWGEEVVEPAGVGIYAAPAFADRVTIQSGQRKLIIPSSVFEDSKVKEVKSRDTVDGTRVVVEGIDLNGSRVDDLRGYAEVDFYLNGEIIPNPLEGEPYLTIPYGRLYLHRRSEFATCRDHVVWEGFPLENRIYSLPGLWVVDTEAVPGELRPQLPHRKSLIRNGAYKKVLEEIRDFVDRWAESELSGFGCEDLPERGDHERLITFLKEEGGRDEVPRVLVDKAQELFYEELRVPLLDEPRIDWEGNRGYVYDLERMGVYVRNDLVQRVSVPHTDADRWAGITHRKLINAQVEPPVSLQIARNARKSTLQPVNLQEIAGGWYCGGWEVEGDPFPGLSVMLWPTPAGQRIVFTGRPEGVARHVLSNTVLWDMALTLHHDLHFSEYWTERLGEFDVLPGRTLVDAYAAMGREEEHARAYVKLQEVARILKSRDLPPEYREVALDGLRDLEQAFMEVGYVSPEHAGPIYTFA
jgi:hypothetical protein